MNIGIITTWYERGASYVSKAYADLLQAKNNVYIYVRDGEYAKSDEKWSQNNVTWGWELFSTDIHFTHFKKWILENKLDILFFNEQRDFEVILKTKKAFPNIVIGSYIDYYTQEMVPKFKFYDFVICNTKRHYSVFKDVTESYYVPWGTDVELFTPNGRKEHEKIVFFHSVGMSPRKGTRKLVKAFIKGELYKNSRLILHTQIDISRVTDYSLEEMQQYGIEVIHKTVGAPGLYHLGDVYVYPTTLEGLGLTIYEALAAGMPVVITDCPPMNEVITEEVGKLVSVDQYYTREDAYYWPLADVNEDSLCEAMRYYIENQDELQKFQKKARDYAVQKWNWNDRENEVNRIFKTACRVNEGYDIDFELKKIKRERINNLLKTLFPIMPDRMEQMLERYITRRR